jgi:eukaryotic-like serine/threonine-protein kinase
MPVTTSSFAAREQYVEAFERARGAGGAIDLAPFTPHPEDPHYQPVLLELVRVDMEVGWMEGRATPLDSYLDRFPALRGDRAALTALTFEEYRLRRQAGTLPTKLEYARRYGIDPAEWPTTSDGIVSGWRDNLPPTHCLVDAARLYRTQRGKLADTNSLGASFFNDLHNRDAYAAERLAEGLTSFPSAGETFHGFKLLRELGRGAFGRVFLAEQEGLAGRHVALKVAADLVCESQALAQLQHTHIVPIYSVHDAGALQAVCMPYLGSLTIADLLADLARRPRPPRTGLGLWTVTQQAARRNLPLPATMVITGPPSEPDKAGKNEAAKQEDAALTPSALAPPIRQRLEGYSYAEAVLWLGACLADGLAHAHERGILHRDLKPANVLLTDDGMPMLLDFNLAEDTKLRNSASGALVGGTLLYMSPEHLETFQGQGGVIDQRSDIYALGVILYQLLTRQHPFITGSTPHTQGVKGANGKASGSSLPELIEEMRIERRRAAPRVRTLNPSVTPAAEAIIRKCLEPDPSRRYQTARELHEDLQRQLEGLPLKHAVEPSLRERAHKWWKRRPRLLGQTAVAGVVVLTLVAGLLMWRSHRLAQTEQAWRSLDGFQQELRAAQGVLTAQAADDPAERDKGVALAQQALQRYPVLTDPDWHRRAPVTALPEAEQQRLRRDMGELLLLVARAEAPTRKQELADAPARLEKTLEFNRLAEACFDDDVPAALWWQRADVLRALGNRAEGERWRSRAEKTPPRTAADFFLSAREFTSQGEPHKAVPLLKQATKLDPRHYWAWFLLGKCLSDTGEEFKAATCYSVCIALQPQSPAAYFQRGLVHIQLKDFAQARSDFDEAVRLNPDYAEAYLNRGLVRQNQKDYKGAVDDFTRALDMAAAPTRVYFMRSRARQLAGDKAGADADFAEGLRREPADEKSWIARGLARMERGKQASDPAAKKAFEQALADFDEALKLNPRSRAALRNKAHVFAEKLNRPKEAIAALDLVVQHHPDFATAYAERGVMHARLGNRDLAVADAEAALERDVSPPLRYQVACIYALTAGAHPNDRGPALNNLRDALRLGYGIRFLADDKDLDAIRTLPEFRRLQDAVAVLQPRR